MLKNLDYKTIMKVKELKALSGACCLAAGLAAALFIGAPSGLNAAFSENDIGTSGAQFLKLGSGARSSAMGGAYSAVSDDPSAIYWNPAGLNQIKERSISVTHSIMFEDIFYDWVSVVKPLAGGGAFGVGVQYMSYGKIMETDDTGLDITNFRPNDIAVIGSYGFKIKDVMLGISGKYISSKIKNTAVAYAADAGAMYKLSGGKISLGLAVQNIGGEIKFNNEGDKLPLNIKFGVAYLIKKNWTVSADVNEPVDGGMYFCGGTEYRYRISKDITLAGRAGYNNSAAATGGINGLAGGLGADFGKYSIDYSFSPFGDIGSVHRISFGMKF